MGELGRSVEFVVNLPWFRGMFTEDELEEGMSRLTLHDFPSKNGWQWPQRITRIGPCIPGWAAPRRG